MKLLGWNSGKPTGPHLTDLLSSYENEIGKEEWLLLPQAPSRKGGIKMWMIKKEKEWDSLMRLWLVSVGQAIAWSYSSSECA